MPVELRWEAMGTDVHVFVSAQDGTPAVALAQLALRRIDELERLWSRFLADSDVSRLNAAAGCPVVVSPQTLLLLERARHGWWLSGGAFDPMVLPSLLAAGYDRSFENLAPAASLADGNRKRTRSVAVLQAPSSPHPPDNDWAVRLLPSPPGEGGGRVMLDAGAGFDPGGIGKGLAADLVVSALIEAGAASVCVNVGGDLRVAGQGPDDGGWTVSVDHPWRSEPVALMGVASGGVATSTTLKRRWLTEAGERHHIIDPRSGQPAETDVNFVTVVAPEAWMAEVLCKAVLINGSSSGFDVLGGTGSEGLAVLDDGSVITSDGFAAYLGAAPVPVSV
jgi:thiamine biosynthesis lipoprotein